MAVCGKFMMAWSNHTGSIHTGSGELLVLAAVAVVVGEAAEEEEEEEAEGEEEEEEEEEEEVVAAALAAASSAAADVGSFGARPRRTATKRRPSMQLGSTSFSTRFSFVLCVSHANESGFKSLANT
jgi:hypothetical protein